MHIPIENAQNQMNQIETKPAKQYMYCVMYILAKFQGGVVIYGMFVYASRVQFDSNLESFYAFQQWYVAFFRCEI